MSRSNGTIRICSFVPFSENGGWKELDTRYLYKYDLKSRELVLIEREHEKILKLSNSVEPDLNVDVELTLNFLREAVKRRCCNLPNVEDPVIAVLFSGGLDSSILAALASQVLPINFEIDLINIAFENNNKKCSKVDKYLVPDRETSLLTFDELTRLFPERPFNFIAVNVPFEEYLDHRQHVINLMAPNSSVMDLSISIALWFASRGIGAEKHSRAKVLLVGSGADEQFGGYSRHRSAWETGGLTRLLEELQLDVDRIPYRNLGRDDRCISDNGKEVRSPYLDEDFVAHASSLPVLNKMDFSLPRGQGEKCLLRKVALEVGFSEAIAYLPKRAIQFGARTAKIEGDSSVKGDSLVTKLL